MTGLYADLRYALRALAKNPGFAAAAVLSLMLGIGANTTIFTLARALLLHPLPVSDSSTLVALYTTDSRTPGNLGNSFLNYKDYRDHNQVFSSLLLYSALALNLTGGPEPRLVMGQLATANYFPALGVTPVVGRGFRPEEDSSPGSAPVAVISYRFWQREFAGDRNVTSRTLSLNGQPFTIIGVAPAGFEGLDTLTATDIWLPFMMYPQVFPVPQAVNNRRSLFFAAVGRLRPGVKLVQAQASLISMAQELEREFPKENRGRGVALTPLAEASLPRANRGPITDFTKVLLAISAVVLLIACGNVASLLLARGGSRQKEIAVRLALGAGRLRLVRQLVIESVVLAVAGGAAALAFAAVVRNVVWALRPPMFDYAAVHLDLDGTVLAYTFGVAVLTGVVFGLAPAWRSTSADLSVDLKERAGRTASHGGRWNPHPLLVMGQVAFTVIALVGAGLFVRSLRNAAAFHPGFDTRNLGVVVFDVSAQGYNEARGRDYRARALQAASAVPGVTCAALAKDWPFVVSFTKQVILEGQENNARRTLAGFAEPGYFRCAGIPLLRGRDFNANDTATAPHVAILNEAAAQSFWPGQDAVGKTIRLAGDAEPVEVVGIARNINYQTLGERPQAFLYLSMEQYYYSGATVWVRTAGPPGPVLAAVRKQVQGLDRNLLLQAQTVGTIIDHSLWAQELSAGLLTLFGGLALLLAGVGVYGVVAYGVTQRQRELGIRMALGATAGDVKMMLLAEGMRLVAIGVVAGLGIALWAVRWLQQSSLLFATNPRDAATFTLVPSLMVLVAIAACWAPARKATRIDPGAALRAE